MKYNSNILEAFRKAYDADQKYIESWMVNWSYQDTLTSRQLNYKDGLPQSFYEYKEPEDIVEWMNWLKVDKLDQFPKRLMKPLMEKAEAFDRKVVEEYNLSFDFEGYENGLARNNAQDYLLANFYSMNNEEEPKRVLDFGSGFGRQANLWNQMENEDYLHISMDAIPKSYCLQHFYYSNINRPQTEYVFDREGFEMKNSSKGIFHLPTWRFDLIPDNFLDKVIVVQVLQELNEQLVKYVLKEFKRILKPDGALYIRDHGNSWRPTHTLNIDEYIQAEVGFTLEYKMHAVDKREFHGIPRIFRPTKTEVEAQENVGSQQKMLELKRKIDASTGGKLSKLIKKVKGK